MSAKSVLARTGAWKASRPGYWESLIDDWRRSGLRQTEFCSRRSVSYYSFCRWKARLLAAGGTGDRLIGARSRRALPASPGPGDAIQFLPVRVRESAVPGRGPTPSPGPSRIEVRLRGGRRVRVHPGFDAHTLQAVVRSLEALAC
jgi:hypothetical protein